MIDVSIVIPTFNRANSLRRCLDALAQQTASPDSYEVVVVDDGSADGTAELLAGYDAPFRLRAERQPNRGPAVARNRGIAAAAGRYCLFLDDDVIADPQLVDEHRRVQVERSGVIGLGLLRLRMVGAVGGLARYFTTWWREHYRRFDEGEREPEFWDCFSRNLSAPTSVLRSAGGFDERLGRSEDVELAYRLERSGMQIVYLPHAGGEQHYSKGVREIIRDFDQAGAAALVLYRRHPELLRYAPLGDFSQGGTRLLLLRRLLLAVGAPVWLLVAVDPLLARRPSARIYRFLQLHCFWRSLRRALDDRDTWLRLTRGTVILMYHAIGQRNEPATRFVLPASRFRRQIAWLRLRRRPILTLDEYLRYRDENRLPPARSVVITFDDGYVDNLQLAVPILRRQGVPATVFVVSGAVGTVNGWTETGPLARRGLLSWAEVRALHDAGMAIGAHTASHPRLTDLDGDSAEREVAQSRVRLEEEIGAPVRHFAYPYGNTSPEVEELVRRAGFASACGVQPGPNGPAVPIHQLRRMEVWGTRSLPRFMIDLWLGRPVGEPRSHGDGD